MSKPLRSNLLARVGLAALVACIAAANVVAADPPKSAEAKTSAKASAKAKADKTQFTRLSKDAKDRATSLDIAITSYVSADGATRVDLVGAIHIADKDYYHRLNKEFEKYDVVLYELVAPKGVRPERGSAGLYSPLANMLELADQIAEVDYTKKNFTHADMSASEMAESMKKRDEHWLKILGQIIAQGVIEASDPNGSANNGALLANLFSAKNPSLAWKRTLAPQFADMEHSTTWLDGPNGSTIVTERNKVALKVLDEQLKAGKKRVAIFYGAAHLPNMERHLIDDLKLKRAGQDWIICWNLATDARSTPKPEKTTPSTKTLSVSEKDFLRASQALLDEPLSQGAKEHAKTVMVFTDETPKASVVITDDEVKWFGKDKNRQTLLTAAYCAGNVQSQLHSGVVRNDRYSGLLYLFKTYRALQAADKEFKIAAVEELLKLHGDDKLLKHVLELEAKKSTKIER